MTRKHQGAGESQTSPRRIESVDRQAQAMKLRASGATYQQIADTLGYANAGGAFKAVSAGLQATLTEPAEELRTLELKRLDELTLALWPRALRGEVTVIDRVLKIMTRRADLLGLDEPARFNIRHDLSREEAEALAREYGCDVEAVIAEAEAIFAQTRDRGSDQSCAM